MINKKISAHVRSNLCDVICFRHLIISEQSYIGFIVPKRPIDLHECATCFELPSNIITMMKILSFNKAGSGSDQNIRIKIRISQPI